MLKTDIAALLALGAALFIAIGDVVHQRSARAVSDASVGHLGVFARLLRDRRWWLGSLVAGGGFALQAAALAQGSVLLVQALLVTSLLFALPISARLTHQRVTHVEWLWAVLLAGSVAVIVTLGNPTEGHSRAGMQTWLVVAAVLGPVLALCVIGARLLAARGAGSGAAVLLALVSGTLWGVFAVLTKTLVERLEFGSWSGLWALLSTPELYAWLAVALGGTAWQQSSFHAGALTASLPTMTIAEPMVAAALGIAVLGETLHPDEAGWLTLIIAVAVMVVATAALARSEAAKASANGPRPSPTSLETC